MVQNANRFNPKDTSWNKASKWYSKSVGTQGHYFHQHTVIPNVIKILNPKPNDSLLDLACGQGVLERSLPKEIRYLGIDASQNLVLEARKLAKNKAHKFEVRNLSQIQHLDLKFDLATCILAVQNIQNTENLFKTASESLIKGGKFLIVINHPCFRIPRHSSWDLDERANVLHRKVDQYMSELTIPVLVNPSKGEQSEKTVSFHKPLSEYVRLLNKAEFVIESLEEWVSDKESIGKRARAENTSRKEIPLFMALLCRKD